MWVPPGAHACEFAHLGPKVLSEKFSKFFIDKIQKIRPQLDSAEDETDIVNDPDGLQLYTTTTSKFCGFNEMSAEEISKLVGSRPNKTCSLDPIPTWLLKSCMPALLQPLTSIVNSSLSSGHFPEALLEAVVTPVIKKASLDKNVMKNYRPVSNIALISKLIEKPAIKQLQDYLTNHDLNELLQSAYRIHHSTETALMKVKGDILHVIGDRKAVFLVMLDLSATFDTVDHDRLIHRLSNRLNITDTDLMWVRSYLSDRKNRVCITGESSATTKMISGMPQGSVVGPWMFTNYVLPIGDIIKHYRLSYHLYADDSQIYTTFNPKIPGDAEVCLFKIRACIREIKRWMTANTKLNDEKTDFFIAANQQDQDRLSGLTLQFDDGNKFSASSNVRNLDVRSLWHQHAKGDRGQILLQCRTSPIIPMEPHPGSNQISPIQWGLQEAVKNPCTCMLNHIRIDCPHLHFPPWLHHSALWLFFHLLLVLVFHSSHLPRSVFFLVEAQEPRDDKDSIIETTVGTFTDPHSGASCVYPYLVCVSLKYGWPMGSSFH